MLQTGFYTLTSAAPAAIYFDTPDTADVVFILAAFAAELRFLWGFKKDEVHAELKDGYLVVSAEKGLDEDEQDKKTGKYLRRERYAGSCQRSFYVGKDITEEDIKAQFQHGMLTLFVPKKEAKPVVEEKKHITIE